MNEKDTIQNVRQERRYDIGNEIQLCESDDEVRRLF